MASNDPFTDRRRASEHGWIRRREAAGLEALRQRAVENTELSRLELLLGVRDADVVRDVRRLGFDAETLPLLFLLPVVHIAWLEGGLTRDERTAIERMRESAELRPNGRAAERLSAWLTVGPPADLVGESMAVLARVLDALPAGEAEAIRERILRGCTRLAKTSGGIAGWFAVSKDERAFLARLDETL